jgi:integrase
MGAKLKKVHGAWYLYVDHQGKRKCKKIGLDRRIAEAVRRQVEAKLALGDLAIFGATDHAPRMPMFGTYADQWLKEYARIECKTSTTDGYEGVLRNYLRPRFATMPLNEIKRERIKSMIAEMIEKGLSRGTIKNAISVLRGMFNEAIEAGIVESNPAARVGRFTRTARNSEKKGIALTVGEVQQFLDAVKEVCPEYYPLFLTAIRAGLRRGELVALRFGDLNFGRDENDSNRYVFVQHNYVCREHTTTKSKKSRRVDMSRDLRRALIELRDARLLAAHMRGESDITEELVFPGPDGGILDPDNLYHRLFIPSLAKAGIRKIRLHDLRHTFGSLLLQNGASITYVKDQLGHASIQLTVDIYGHLIPGADVSFADRLDDVLKRSPETSSQINPNQPQTPRSEADDMPAELVDLIGGGGRTRTYDLRIMRPSL